MARKWAKQEIDLRILKALYDHKYLRGKTLAMIGNEGEKRGYERISALEKQGFLSKETLVKRVNIGPIREEKYMNRKVAAIYYLTARGECIVKENITHEEISGTEKTRRPIEQRMVSAYSLSLLLEQLFDLYDEIIPVLEYKRKNNLANFLPILMAHKKAMFFLDDASPSSRKNLFLQAQSLAERFERSSLVVLVKGKRSHYELLNYYKENYGQDELILHVENIYGIRHILSDRQIFKNYFKLNDIDFEELSSPKGGYSYKIDGEYAHLYDLVGLPAKRMRRIRKLDGKIYIGITSQEEVKLLNRLYPEMLKKDIKYLKLENLLNKIKFNQEVEIKVDPGKIAKLEKPDIKEIDKIDKWGQASSLIEKIASNKVSGE